MDTIAHFLRIKKYLGDKYKDKIDTSSFKGKPIDIENQFFTRAFIAQSLEGLCHHKIDNIENLITDSKHDNGIDFIYQDPENFTLYIGQSKWSKDGNISVSKNDFLNFKNGFNDLINLRFENFNESVIKKADIVTDCISSIEYSIVGLFCYAGYHDVSQEVQDIIDKSLKQLNKINWTFDIKCVNQKFLYQSILQVEDGFSIDLTETRVFNYGHHNSPFTAVYGEVEVKSLALLWDRYGKSLLNKNLRRFKGSTSVNQGIKHTLSQEPDMFWYYNNGITVLCKKIKRYPESADSTTFGKFDFIGSSVVNGGQTLGSIGEAYKLYPDDIINSSARVQIRFIELEEESEYITKIARFNNTQNRIENKDFAALDPFQEVLRKQYLLMGIQYVYKSGDSILDPLKGFTINEALVARACFTSVENCAQITREIGFVWIDINKPPYTTLFNVGLDLKLLWNCVKVVRLVEEVLGEYINNHFTHKKTVLICQSGQNFLTFKVLNYLDSPSMSNSENYVPNRKNIKEDLVKIIELTERVLDTSFSNDHITNVFKSANKCAKISDSINYELGREYNLFNPRP